MNRKQNTRGFTPAKLLRVFAAALCCGWYFSTGRGMASPPPEHTVSLLFCGDVMLDWGIKEAYRAHGPKYSLGNIGGFMNTFDFRFCNLECAVSYRASIRLTSSYHYTFTDFLDNVGPSAGALNTVKGSDRFLFNSVSLHVDLFSDPKTKLLEKLFAEIDFDYALFEDEDNDMVFDGWDNLLSGS